MELGIEGADEALPAARERDPPRAGRPGLSVSAGSGDRAEPSAGTRVPRRVSAADREGAEAAALREAARVRAALDLAEGRLEALAASVQDRMLAFDAGGRVTEALGSPLELEGAAPAPVGSEIWRALAEPALAPVFRRALTGESASQEWRTGSPGQERWYEVRVSPVRVHRRVLGGVAVVRDVTATKLLQTRLAISDRMATLGSIAAGAAHDLCAPVTAVLSALDEVGRLAREHGSALGAAVHPLLNALSDARAAGEQVQSVARDLRTFSRGEPEVSASAAADVHAVLDSAVRMAAHELRGRARVVREFGAVPPVAGSVSRLGQVFLNLLVNAAQAIAPGAPERNEVRLRTGVAADGRVAVDVEDTGAGMPPEVRRRLFTPFFTTKPEGVGTGLGLAICRRIVAGLGGKIRVRSEPGRGTLFRVLLPVASAPADPPPAPPQAPPSGTPPEPPSPPAAGPARRARVLLVDDEESVHRAMGRLLGRTYDVTCADAAAALEAFERGARFDLVLCDVSMPGISGIEVRRRLEARAPDQAARMVFLTGGAFGEEARAFLARPDILVIDKAAPPREIRLAIEERIRKLGPAEATGR